MQRDGGGRVGEVTVVDQRYERASKPRLAPLLHGGRSMSAQGGHAQTAFIERVCDAHQDRDPEGPLVTTVEGVWAFCAGHGAADHNWRVVEPVTRQRLEADLLTRDADALGPAAS